ncbi:MAG: acetyl-CoA carboxylase biotin carboxyl carrier protein [Proteobacteria bacterium]|nr:acetyl-CoA carboxylase biotin carboxyl carrier protein [Pseudomonadota bacterium]
MPEKKFAVDPDLIRKLAEILTETGLGEIEYAEGERRIRVARPAVHAAANSTPPMAAATIAAASAAPSSESDAPPPGAITSPMVGTAFLAPEPGATPFIKAAEKVKEGQTLLIIEAMKVMNPIKSPRAGTVSRILVTDGAPVEYGQPLLVIE